VNEPRSSGGRGGLDALAVAITFCALGAGLFLAFVGIDGWAVKTFARPVLASALIAVVDVALLALAVALAPALSALIRRLVGLGRA
jgi:hypothetical protein